MNNFIKLTIAFLVVSTILANIFMFAQIKETQNLKAIDQKRIEKIEGLKRDLLYCGETVRQQEELLRNKRLIINLKEIE